MPNGKGLNWFSKKTPEQLAKEKRNREAAGKMAKALAAAAPAAIAGTAGVGAVGYETLTTLAGSNPTIERMFPDLKDHRTITEASIDAWEDRTSVESQTQVSLRLARELGAEHATAREREFNFDSFWGMSFIELPDEFSERTVSTEQGLGSVIDVVSNEIVDSQSEDDFKKKVHDAYIDSYNRTLGGLFLGDIDLVHTAAENILAEDALLTESGTVRAPMLSSVDFYADSRMHRLSDQYRGLETYDDAINAEYNFYVQQYTERLRADLYEISLAAAGSITETERVYAAREFRFSEPVQNLLNEGSRVLLDGGLLFEPIMNDRGELDRIQVRVVPVNRTTEGASSVELTPFALTNPIAVDYNHGLSNGITGGDYATYATIDRNVSYEGGYDFSSLNVMAGIEGIIAPEGTAGFPVWYKTGEGAADLSGVDPTMLNFVSTALIETFTELRSESIYYIPVITSGIDTAPQRVEDTAHTLGLALDIRVNQFDTATQARIAEMIGSRLPAGCTVILETPRSQLSRQSSHTHIHIECESAALDTAATGTYLDDRDRVGATVFRISLRGNRR